MTAVLMDRVDVVLGYSHFWDGDFVDNTNLEGVSGTADFFYGQTWIRF